LSAQSPFGDKTCAALLPAISAAHLVTASQKLALETGSAIAATGRRRGYFAHGVHKAGATRTAERDASEFALMAIFGWRSGKQAVHYTRAANQMEPEFDLFVFRRNVGNSAQSS
jgi:hypothetical protein